MNEKQKFLIAFTIIGTICLSMILIFTHVVVNNSALTPEAREMISGVVMSMIAVVSMMIGMSNKNGNCN